MKFKWKETKWGSYTFAIVVGVVLYEILEHFGTVLDKTSRFLGFFKPVIIGIIIAYIVNILCNAIKRYILRNMKNQKAQSILAILLSILLIVLLIALAASLLISPIITSVNRFASNIWNYTDSIDGYINLIRDWATDFGLELNFDTVSEYGQKIVKTLTQNMKSLAAALTSVGSGFVVAAISCFIAVYALFAKDALLKSFQRLFHLWLSEENYNTLIQISAKSNQVFSKYIMCSLLEALFVGIVNGIFMAIVGMQYIPIVSLVVGITNLAPTFGPIIGGVIGTLILLLENPLHALLFVIFTFILQFIDGYVIKPKLYGEAFNVPSIWILVAIVVFGRMLGVIGILLAIPFAAIICFLMELYMAYLEKKKALKESGVE